MENELSTQVMPEGKYDKFSTAIKIGIIIAVIKILLNTIGYQFFIGNWIATSLVGLTSFVFGIAMYIYIGKQQRKMLGGYITIKDAFQVIFVAILISVVITYFYDIIYMKWIDPNLVDKIKESSMSFAEKMGATQDRLDKMSEEFDKSNTEKWSFNRQAISLLSSIVLNSIIGFICAAIVKKNKPAYMA